MPDVMIRHCMLRIVRRGGWGWPASRQTLTDGAVRVLPELIAQRLALWLHNDDMEIASPVRVDVPLTSSELLNILGTNGTGGEFGHVTQSAFGARLADAIDRAIQPHLPPGRRIMSRSRSADDPPRDGNERRPDPSLPQGEDVPGSVGKESDPGGGDRLAVEAGATLRLLLDWRDRGELGLFLLALSEPTLEHWLTAVRSMSVIRSPATPESVATQDIERVVESIRGAMGKPMDRATNLRYRIIVAVEMVHRLGLPPNDARVLQAMDRTLPSDGPNGSLISADDPASAEHTASQLRATKRSVGRTKLPTRRGRADLHIDCALPFLMLGPLSRIGFLQALAAAFEAAGLAEDLPAFAGALAYKALSPPQYGWNRGRDSIAAASAFAGLDGPVPEPAMLRLARLAHDFVTPLNAAITRSLLVQPHDDGALLLCRVEQGTGGGLLLVDPQGIFTVTWGEDLDALSWALDQCDTRVLLIDRDTADPSLLAALNRRNLRFVTEAPPTRKESWRAVRGRGSRRWWTNDSAGAEISLARHGRLLAGAVERTRALWRALAVERPAIPLADDPTLERVLTLTAAVALGQIAWDLWRNRERTDPLLTIERFGDLSARVKIDQRTVRVVLPLGRRSTDLAEHGFLKDVAAVPWLGGRVVTFGQG